MTQPINRETAIALAKEAGMAGMLTDVVCSLEEIHRLCNLAVAHSRKDAEPVDIRAAMKKAFYLGQTYWQQTDSEYVSQQNKSDATKAKFDALLEETVINATHPPEADKPIDKLTGCACRWDENDNRVLTCVRHQGWLDVVEEWATTAKENQVVIDRLTSKRQETEQNTNGTDYVSDAQFDALILELQSITEEARATDYHDALRKAALFLSLLKSKVHKYANDIVRLDAACTEQHAAYTSAHNRLNEADKLLQQALKTLTYHTKQTRPILQTDAACRAIRTYLEGKK